MSAPDMISAQVRAASAAGTAASLAANCAIVGVHEGKHCQAYADVIRGEIASIRAALDLVEAAVAAAVPEQVAA